MAWYEDKDKNLTLKTCRTKTPSPSSGLGYLTVGNSGSGSFCSSTAYGGWRSKALKAAWTKICPTPWTDVWTIFTSEFLFSSLKGEKRVNRWIGTLILIYAKKDSIWLLISLVIFRLKCYYLWKQCCCMLWQYSLCISWYGSLRSELLRAPSVSHDSGHGSRFSSMAAAMPLSWGGMIWAPFAQYT